MNFLLLIHMTNMAEIVEIGTHSHRPSVLQVPQDLQRDFNTKCSTLRINCIASVLAFMAQHLMNF